MHSDHRQTRRAHCRTRFLGAATKPLGGTIVDFSITGLCLSLEEPLPLGREFHLDFDLPTGRVDAMGEVRWATEEGEGNHLLGIRFVRISSESLAAIAQALKLNTSGLTRALAR